MSRKNRNKAEEARVSNPFGSSSSATPHQSQFGMFGQSTAGSAPSSFGSFGRSDPIGKSDNRMNFGSSSFGQPAFSGSAWTTSGTTGQRPETSKFGSMNDDSVQSPSARVVNPFASFGGAANAKLTLHEAVSSYKEDFLKKKGYPFSCFGSPDEIPVMVGDISPAELRWHLSQNTPVIHTMIAERSRVLGVDFADFLRAGMPVGSAIQRTGPYVVPEPNFPSFVPRGSFKLSAATGSLSEAELSVYKGNDVPDGVPIPGLPPPLELR